MKIVSTLYALCLLATGILCGCAGEAAPAPTTAAAATEPPTIPTTEATEPATEPKDPLKALLDTMTLRQKVGQLFIVRPDALEISLTPEQISAIHADGVTCLTDTMREALLDYPVGGVCMFGKNLTSPEQITDFHRALQAASPIPMFLAVDEEGGLVSRLAGHEGFDLPRYRNAASVGSTGDPENARDMGRTIGGYLSELGFNLNFAPVADVNTNPDNPVIGKRAFSSQPQTAADMAEAFAQGLREQGIIATFKHFPGHGDTAEDSHLGLAVSNRTREQLLSCELLPFIRASAQDMVMVGHIALPNVTGNMTPATLSRELVTELLKEEMGFEGLVITDALEMSAITQLHSAADAAVLALEAGCDLLLIPAELQEAFESVMAALEQGRLSVQWLDETVLGILRFKAMHGILSLS